MTEKTKYTDITLIDVKALVARVGEGGEEQFDEAGGVGRDVIVESGEAGFERAERDRRWLDGFREDFI